MNVQNRIHQLKPLVTKSYIYDTSFKF